jgi:hypothetical protein
MWIIAFCLVLTQFYRTRADIVESRPDAVAAVFAALAVWFFYLGHTKRALYLFAGILAMLIGFFFKQTASAVALVPIVGVLLAHPRPLPRHLAMALLPPIVIAATILCLRLFLPAVYFYMVTVPTLFEFRTSAWPLDIVNLITTNVLFDIALVLWLAGICTSRVSRTATVWILAAVLVTGIACGAAVAKIGGQTNSYLMAFLAMAAFTIVILPGMLERLAAIASSPRANAVLAAFLGLILLADATGVAGYEYWTSNTRVYGDKHYRQIVKRVQKLPGKVVCPDDPTIPLKAKGYVGRSLTAELDALGWHSRPEYLHSELKKADWVIRVGGAWTPQVSPKELKELGFKQVNDPAFAKTAYILYQRKAKS